MSLKFTTEKFNASDFSKTSSLPPLTVMDNVQNMTSSFLEEDDELISIAIEDIRELDNFADCQYMISKPLCLVCEDVEILEQALRLYQGRALYEGSLSDEELLPLVEKYGLII